MNFLAGGGKLPFVDDYVSATATPTLTNIYNGLVEPVKQGWSWWVLILIVLAVLAVGYLVVRWWTNR